MYVKFTEVLDGHAVMAERSGNAVVPTRRTILEGDRIEYAKRVLEAVPELQVYEVIGNEITKGDEVLEVRVYRSGERCQLIFANKCSMYIMNDQGNTIDSLVCS